MNRTILRIAGACLVAAALAGCGGGGGGGGGYYPFPPVVTNPPPTTPPQQSPYDKFLDYVKTLVAQALDMVEPADVTAFDPPPVSETLEPIATQ